MDIRKYLLAIVLFLMLTCLVIGFPIVTKTDISIISAIQNMMAQFSSRIPVTIGEIGYGYKFWIPILFVVLLLIIKRKYISCILFVLTIQASVLASDILKIVIARPRPPIEMQVTPLTNFAFPSGHSILNMCFFGICIYLVNRYVENDMLKLFIISFCAFMILFVGFTRLWLGVHHPTDIIGGYIIGYIFVMIFCDLEKRIQKD